MMFGRKLTSKISSSCTGFQIWSYSRTTHRHFDSLTDVASRVGVRKSLRRSATFEEIHPSSSPIGDPFISGPYSSGTTLPEEMKLEKKEEAEAYQTPPIDPQSRTVITFPGDGTQFVGMCGNPNKLTKHIQSLYHIASGVLKYDLLDLCSNGPVEKLNQTRYSQPAIFVSSLAALEKLRDRDSYAVEHCNSTAGFSVGEIAALVFAGSLDFEDAVHFVKNRAEAMQLAGEIIPSGLSLVFYGADSKLGDAMMYAKEWCTSQYQIQNPICSVAHYLFPHCKIIGGNKQALEFIELNAQDFKLRKVKRLPAAAAYHTELMRPAAEPLKVFLKNITIQQPRIRVYSCHTGVRYNNPKQIQRDVVKQIYTGVKWQQLIHGIFERPQNRAFPLSFECGPGHTLGPIFKMVNRRAYENHRHVTP